MNRLGTLAALALCACACSQEVEPELMLECDGTCDQQVPQALGVVTSPEAVHCTVSAERSELVCELLPSVPELPIESVTLTMLADGETTPQGTQLTVTQPLARRPLPVGAQFVEVGARFEIADDATALGAAGQAPLRALRQVPIGTQDTAFSLALPIDLWRVELLAYSNALIDFDLGLVDREPSVLLEPGQRNVLSLVAAPGTESIRYSGSFADAPGDGEIDAATIFAVTELGIAGAEVEQIPVAAKGELAATCTQSEDLIVCEMADLPESTIGKIHIKVYGADGSESSFIVSPRFGTSLRINEEHLPVQIVATVPISSQVLGAPFDSDSVELRGTIGADDNLGLYLPFELFEVSITSDVDIASLLVEGQRLDLGRTMDHWFSYLGDTLQVSMPSSDAFVRMIYAVPPGTETVHATIRTVDEAGTFDTVADLHEGNYRILESGIAQGL